MAAVDTAIPDGDRWNSNIHYHDLLVDSLSTGARDVLDVGCGEGMLCRRLHATGRRVIGIDSDPASIELARSQSPEPSDGVTYVCDDFLTNALEPSSFDAVLSVAALHHMDPGAALSKMKRLLRPGGTLAVVGLARSQFPYDLPFEVASATVFTYYRLTKKRWEHPSPTVWPPPQTYADMRRIAGTILPGAVYRRRLQWRYSLVWRKPDRPLRASAPPGGG